MLPMRIGLSTQSASVAVSDLARVAAAISVQINRDVGPIWNLSATVAPLPDPDQVDPGVWPVHIVDAMDEGMSGFHLTEHNQPYALVLAGDTWSLTASHEILEMLVDPSGNRLVAAPAVAIVDNEVQDAAGKFEYLVEVCDPSEDPTCAYLIDGVLVSDFYTPNYFDPTGSAGARYSFSGKITRPRQVLPNGYLTWYNPANNRLQQVRHFGAPEIVDLATGMPGAGSMTGGLSLRSFVDARTTAPVTLSKLHAASEPVQARRSRQTYLAAAAPGRARLYAAAIKTLGIQRDQATARIAAAAALDIPAVLAAHLVLFQRPGILSARPGRRFRSNSAGEGVIVVTVAPGKTSEIAAALPASLDGVPVDVRTASAMQVMQSAAPADYRMVADARHELRQPDFPNQSFFDPSGTPVQHTAALAAFAAGQRKQQLDYQPADVPLAPFTGPATLILHASPDAGWDQLSTFLAGVPASLVVGMYDFTSRHVLDALEEALAGGKTLTLTLDHPAPNPSRDQTDEQTRSELEQKLGPDFRAAWALTNADRMATAWIYPNAYHIKVAVRDDGMFWLSSGNWNNSNQPEIDLSDPDAARKIAAASDRDWHVIADCPALADTFRAYLEKDFDLASQHNVAPAKATAALAAVMPEPEVPAAAFAAGRAPRSFFAPKRLSATLTIQPLLTPDNYQTQIKALIESARSRFYMQTQYIHPSGRPGDEDHDALIAAVKSLTESGVDVRLITSEFQTDDWVEKLVGAGIPASVLRRQPKVHNKGILVDGQIAVVSSQNWSADGTLRNRDAGLIIHSAEATAYFEQIFLHDWDNLASPVTA